MCTTKTVSHKTQKGLFFARCLEASGVLLGAPQTPSPPGLKCWLQISRGKNLLAPGSSMILGIMLCLPAPHKNLPGSQFQSRSLGTSALEKREEATLRNFCSAAREQLHGGSLLTKKQVRLKYILQSTFDSTGEEQVRVAVYSLRCGFREMIDAKYCRC